MIQLIINKHSMNQSVYKYSTFFPFHFTSFIHSFIYSFVNSFINTLIRTFIHIDINKRALKDQVEGDRASVN